MSIEWLGLLLPGGDHHAALSRLASPSPGALRAQDVRRQCLQALDRSRLFSVPVAATFGSRSAHAPLSPSTIHFYRFTQYGEPGVYASAKEFFVDLGKVYQQEIAELAAAGCRYVQPDEVALAMPCDPAAQAKVICAGGNPDELVRLYVDAINEAVKGRPAEMVVGVHMCRGNYKGMYPSEGGYTSIAEELFNRANVNHFLLEFDSPRAGDFAPLGLMPKDKGVVLGLLSSKSKALEPLDLLRRRTDEAARYVDLEHLAISPQCGFASTMGGIPVTEADERAKARLCVEAADQIWGRAKS